MGIFKNLLKLKKEETSCCSVKIEEVKEEQKVESQTSHEQNGGSCCGK
jgi:hypothetical protein